MYTITLNINTEEKKVAEDLTQKLMEVVSVEGIDLISSVVHEEMTMKEKIEEVLATLAEYNESFEKKLDEVIANRRDQEHAQK